MQKPGVFSKMPPASQAGEEDQITPVATLAVGSTGETSVGNLRTRSCSTSLLGGRAKVKWVGEKKTGEKLCWNGLSHPQKGLCKKIPLVSPKRVHNYSKKSKRELVVAKLKNPYTGKKDARY